MCGIVGLFAKSPEMEASMGRHIAAMLMEMSDRGPDSAGIAIYHDAAPDGATKGTVQDPVGEQDWEALGAALRQRFGEEASLNVRANHGVLSVPGSAESVRSWLRENHPALRVTGSGQSIEIFKDKLATIGCIE